MSNAYEEALLAAEQSGNMTLEERFANAQVPQPVLDPKLPEWQQQNIIVDWLAPEETRIVETNLSLRDAGVPISDLMRATFAALETARRKAKNGLGKLEKINAEMVEELAGKYYREEKAKQIAKRKLASETYTGTVEMSWDDLELASSSFLIQDAIPDKSVGFIVAKPNIGKTFLYIDAVCRIACGLPWFGKSTRQAKVLIVLGEGVNGFVDRLHAWCEANGKTRADLEPWLFFVNGCNLNNDTSLERIAEVSKREAVELTVYDTYAGTSGVLDENDTPLNVETVKRSVSVSPETTHWFVHHPRKSDEDTEHPVMRGAGGLMGMADFTWTMFRDRKYIAKSGPKRDYLSISTEAEHAGKNRSARTETIRGLFLQIIGKSAVMEQVEGESMSKESSSASQHLTGIMTVGEFATASGLAPSTAAKYLKTALVEGTVRLVEVGSKAQHFALAAVEVDWASVVHQTS